MFVKNMNSIQDYKETILSIDDLLTNILYFTGHDYDEIEINELRIYYNDKVKKMLNFVYRYNDKCSSNKCMSIHYFNF